MRPSHFLLLVFVLIGFLLSSKSFYLCFAKASRVGYFQASLDSAWGEHSHEDANVVIIITIVCVVIIIIIIVIAAVIIDIVMVAICYGHIIVPICPVNTLHGVQQKLLEHMEQSYKWLLYLQLRGMSYVHVYPSRPAKHH